MLDQINIRFYAELNDLLARQPLYKDAEGDKRSK
jgi:hypothetical protein